MFSRSRGARDLAEWFLRAVFAHLPPGLPVMFRVEELCPNSSSPPRGLISNFTNKLDAYHLPGKVFWRGCNFIVFTTYNIFTDLDRIFSTRYIIHNLPYYLGENTMEEEQ
ncbi:Auxin-induced protein 5NG4 [Hordeum vulgare]|nr:Auxin-induced protein 5NG4 [Hordeum vulgare]